MKRKIWLKAFVTVFLVCLSLCLACACNSSDSDDNSSDLENETSAEYFNFTLLSDDTYKISAKDISNIPAEVVIPSTYNSKAVTSIGYAAFYDCDSLTSVVIPNSVTSIGGGAFVDCDSLTSVIIPDSVISIGGIAFASCDSLTSVVIGDSVTSIADRAFEYCGNLTSVTVSDKNKYYSSLTGDLYNKDKTILIQYAIGKQDASFTIPDSVTSIGAGAFAGCDSRLQ